MNLVNELQISAERDDVLTVLRRAQRAATKLGVTDISQWLDRETDGYGDEEEVPEYRCVTCEVGFYSPSTLLVRGTAYKEGFYPLPLQTVIRPIRWRMNELLTTVSETKSKAGRLCLPVQDEEVLKLLRSALPPFVAQRVTFHYSANIGQVEAIQEAVKDKVLKWALALERRGVLGENMTFSDREKEKAHTLRLDLTDCTIQQLGNIDNKDLVKMSDHSNRIDTGGGNIDNRGGNFVQARDITRSFNALAEKADNQELAAKLRKLAEAINSEILAKLPPDQQAQVAEEAEELAKEATGKARDAVLKALGGAFQETVKAVAGWAVPVVGPLVVDVITSAVRR